ncbi:DUF3710 domain-containing protein [Aldersonia sp. NBC_00410]|uniref:DUF3710 domain-containing protein n=1 Tax=Aldersonia sp. NBC_00410 TaxID=2975954 RepID=UPI002254EA9A|nr:DUF3710 domain-containing protein [Aldersonia sp. NBC_00410]MCX5042562.1 DUF3710 domain-containing protein [Aldersonia sp. NBC_00410]
MFGRRKKGSARDGAEDEASDSPSDIAEPAEREDDDQDPPAPEGIGPYDIEDVDDELAAVLEQRLDLGSVVVPVPEGAQLQVEMGPDGTPQGVHLTTSHGRITVAAYAAPKSRGQWREVVGEIADSMREQNLSVSIETGEWGRELVVPTQAADLRFVGVDGPRWMVRLVAAAPPGAGVPSDGPLAAASRAVLRETVVRRGTDPLPVRAPLPVVLPTQLAEQLAAAYNQQVAAQQATQGQPGQQPAPSPQVPAEAPASQADSPQPPPVASANALAGQSADTPAGESAPGSGQPKSKRRRGSAMQQIGRNPGESNR